MQRLYLSLLSCLLCTSVSAQNAYPDFVDQFARAEALLDSARQVKDTAAMASALTEMGYINERSNNRAAAKEYYSTGAALAEAARDSQALVPLYNGLGNLQYTLRPVNPDSGLIYHQRVLGIILKTDPDNLNRLGGAYVNLARGYARKGEHRRAVQVDKQALALFERARDTSNAFLALALLGDHFMQLDEPDSAKVRLDQALRLSRRSGDIDDRWVHYSLGTYWSNLGSLDSSNYHFQHYGHSTAKAARRNEVAKIAEMEVRFQSKEKQTEIDRLALEDEVSQLRIKRLGWGLGLGLVALGFLGSLLYLLLKQRRRIQHKNELISKALGEKETLLREIHHRVKNNLQMVSSLLSLQSDYIENDAAVSALKMGQSRVRSMAIIHQKLYMRDDVVATVNARDYLDQLISELMATLNVTGLPLTVTRELEPVSLDIDRLIPLGLVANELITNSMKYAFAGLDSGHLSIGFHRSGSDYELVVADNGIGLASDLKAGDSFGSLLISTFAEQLEGEVTVDGESGTRVTLRFPVEE